MSLMFIIWENENVEQKRSQSNAIEHLLMSGFRYALIYNTQIFSNLFLFLYVEPMQAHRPSLIGYIQRR